MECLAETGANGPLLFGIIAIALLAIAGAILLMVRNRKGRTGALLILGLVAGLGLLPLACAPNAHAGIDCNGKNAAPAVTVTTTAPGTDTTTTATETAPGATSTATETGPTVTETGPTVTETTSVPAERVCASAGANTTEDFLTRDQHGEDPGTEVLIPADIAKRVELMTQGKAANGDALCDARPIQWTWKQETFDYTDDKGTPDDKTDDSGYFGDTAAQWGPTTTATLLDDGKLSVRFKSEGYAGFIDGTVGPRPSTLTATGKLLYTGADGKPAQLVITLTDDTLLVGPAGGVPGVGA